MQEDKGIEGQIFDRRIRPWRLAFGVSAIYMLCAGIYIILSSWYVARHAHTVSAVQLSEMQKGLIFMMITGLLLGLGLAVIFRAMARQQKKIIRQRNALLISERHAVAGMLASSVAHDINNVLTMLANTVYFLKKIIQSSEEADSYVLRIQEANAQLTALTRRLLRVGTMQKHAHAQPFDLNRILKESLEFAKTHKTVQNCRVRLVCSAQIGMYGFPDLIQQMLFNLIINAAQATQGKGEILVRVSRDNQSVSLRVSDNGPGIPRDKREAIFEPFYTTKEEGTGLGMLSVQACVEAHGGGIRLADSGQGGAEFIVDLPRRVSDK